MCESHPSPNLVQAIGLGSQFMCSDWLRLNLIASMSDRIGSCLSFSSDRIRLIFLTSDQIEFGFDYLDKPSDSKRSIRSDTHLYSETTRLPLWKQHRSWDLKTYCLPRT